MKVTREFILRKGDLDLHFDDIDDHCAETAEEV
jgi:hypothetical protein